MKIFDAAQIKKWDAATIKADNISPTELMQRAATVCARWIKKRFDRSTSFFVACGKGGNGGDGLVIARELKKAGYKVAVLLTTPPDHLQGATLDQWNHLKTAFPAIETERVLVSENIDTSFFENTAKPTIIIDALLGTGFRPGQQNEYISQVIESLNASTLPIIAIDLPSGLSPDNLPDKNLNHATIIQATHTLTFQAYKRSFLHPETSPYTGQIRLLDIGLSKHFKKSEAVNIYATNRKAASKIYQPRNDKSFGHKGTFGTAVLVGGSYGKIGAIGLSAKAALRAGAGKVFIQAPKCGYEILQTSIAEAMFEPAGDSYVANINSLDKATFGIGPGMDTHPESVSALKAFLKDQKSAMVLDADALNIISQDAVNLLPFIPKNSILTPHPGEFKRLFSPHEDQSSMEQVQLAQTNALKWKITIVLKGHRTAVCTPNGNIYYNLSGNAGIATAGSGDVLTGIITSLLAQGYSPEDSAILGVYLHGLSGDCYIKKGGEESLIAHDLIDCLPKAFHKLGKK